MKYSIKLSYVILGLLTTGDMAQAALTLKVAEPKTYGQKTIVKMDLRNTFTNAIESARAVMFLLDEKA